MLHGYSEAVALALYQLVIEWNHDNPKDTQVLTLLHHAETVLPELFPGIKSQR